jgi:HSP20 family protein
MSNPNDPTAWMWAQACELMDEATRLHRQFFRPLAPAPAMPVWEPPADVFEDECEVVIVVAMPGVPSEQVEVSFEDGVAVVRGVRQLPLRDSRHLVRQLEIPYGGFERRVALPPGRLQTTPPQFVQGCVVISLKKLDR